MSSSILSENPYIRDLIKIKKICPKLIDDRQRPRIVEETFHLLLIYLISH